MTDKHHHGGIEEIDCLEALEQLYAYLDGELDDEVERAKFENHVQHCRSCFSRRELEKELNRKLKRSADGEVPESLQNRLKDLIHSL
jgi:anti-sigma factor (TIGR02949 family)